MVFAKQSERVNDDLLVQENVALQDFNTLAVPVAARFFCRATTIKQLRAGLAFAKKQRLPVLILGEGSNTVFTEDFNGLVILNRLRGIEKTSETDGHVIVRAAAGENWHDFVDVCLSKRWFGLENLALIPGLVGAAPIQNIGAYGVEVKDAIVSVTYLELATGVERTIDNAACEFDYRDSIFKNKLNEKTVITSVEFRLAKAPCAQLAYPALANQLGVNPSPRDIFNRVCDVRSAKLPLPKDIPNAGSFFKNPVIDNGQFQALSSRYPDIVSFVVSDGIKLAAAWLIEQRGWKQKEVAGVKVHQQQALVVTNPKYKSGKNILLLAQAIQKDIEEAFGVRLEIEPRIH